MEYKPISGLTAVSVVNWDAVGAMGSLVCLLHCLMLPAAVAPLPWLALFAGEWLHQGLAVALAVPALLAFVSGWRRHGRRLPGVLLAGGLVALYAAAFAAPEDWETALTVLGGLTLIAAHGLNHRLCRRCPRCAADGGRT
jgi:MFS family permease